jgi:hypothetical protein
METLIAAELVSDRVTVSEASTEALRTPVVDSVRAIESDAESTRLATFVVLSVSVSASDAIP